MDEFPSLNNDFGARKQRYGSNEHIYAVGNQFPSYGGTSGNYALNYNSAYYQPTVCHQQDFYGGVVKNDILLKILFEICSFCIFFVIHLNLI